VEEGPVYRAVGQLCRRCANRPRPGRGNDPRQFARAVINPRPATTSLPRREGLSSSASGATWFFWSIACDGSTASNAGCWSKKCRGAWGNTPRPRFTCISWGIGRGNFPGRKPPQNFALPWDKVHDAVEYLVNWRLEHPVLGAIRAIGVDEIQHGKGHKYLTRCIRSTWAVPGCCGLARSGP